MSQALLAGLTLMQRVTSLPLQKVVRRDEASTDSEVRDFPGLPPEGIVLVHDL